MYRWTNADWTGWAAYTYLASSACLPLSVSFLLVGIIRPYDVHNDRRIDVTLEKITPHLRMPLLTVRDIMKVVKPSGIVDKEQWIEALDYLAAVSRYCQQFSFSPSRVTECPAYGAGAAVR